MAGVREALPAGAGRGHDGLVLAVEQIQATLEAVDETRLEAVGEDQQAGAVGVFLGGGVRLLLAPN